MAQYQPRPGVLVVDDERAILDMLAMALTDHGFAVWLAGDTASAVELFRQHRGAIAVVLLDVQCRFSTAPASWRRCARSG